MKRDAFYIYFVCRVAPRPCQLQPLNITFRAWERIVPANGSRSVPRRACVARCALKPPGTGVAGLRRMRSVRPSPQRPSTWLTGSAPSTLSHCANEPLKAESEIMKFTHLSSKGVGVSTIVLEIRQRTRWNARHVDSPSETPTATPSEAAPCRPNTIEQKNSRTLQGETHPVLRDMLHTTRAAAEKPCSSCFPRCSSGPLPGPT